MASKRAPRKKKIESSSVYIFHTFRIQNTFYSLSKIQTSTSARIYLAESLDGKIFSKKRRAISILSEDGISLDYNTITDATVSTPSRQEYVLCFSVKKTGRPATYIATSSDLLTWKTVSKIGIKSERAFIVHSTDKKHPYAALLSGMNGLVRLAYSKDLSSFQVVASPVLTPRSGYFDCYPVTVHATYSEGDTVYVVYASTTEKNSGIHSVFGFASFDAETLERVTFRAQAAIHQISSLTLQTRIIGGILDHQDLLLYLQESPTYDVSRVVLPSPLQSFKSRSGILLRSYRNPILKPNSDNTWESVATFNPAVYFDGTKTHILYRAVGDDGRSVLGYAGSDDGIHITERLPYPVYVPRNAFESYGKTRPLIPSPLVSGPGWGGCEDPKISRIGDRLYMTYVAFDGWNNLSAAFTSIKVNDFLNKEWRWTAPQIMARPIRSHRDGQMSNIKSACILPEKINNKFVIFFRVFPDICIDYRDQLTFRDGKWLSIQDSIPARENNWDGLKVSIGAPPIKTKDGWLVFYSGVDHRDSRYKIGVMLLSLNDPKMVLYRSNTPILAPDEWYENEGKAGIIYPCGATLDKETLRVYYGGADTVTCVATCNLNTLMEHLKKQTEAVFQMHRVEM